MADDLPPLINSSTSTAANRSLVEDVAHLVADGKVYLEAELQYQKARAGVVGSGARKAVLLGALGFAFLLLALLAITVGTLLALAPVFGVWGAMAAVTVGLLLGGAGCALAARGKWRAAMQHLEDVRLKATAEESSADE
jgi:uncharacterized membrane protein YqjE